MVTYTLIDLTQDIKTVLGKDIVKVEQVKDGLRFSTHNLNIILNTEVFTFFASKRNLTDILGNFQEYTKLTEEEIEKLAAIQALIKTYRDNTIPF